MPTGSTTTSRTPASAAAPSAMRAAPVFSGAIDGSWCSSPSGNTRERRTLGQRLVARRERWRVLAPRRRRRAGGTRARRPASRNRYRAGANFHHEPAARKRGWPGQLGEDHDRVGERVGVVGDHDRRAARRAPGAVAGDVDPPVEDARSRSRRGPSAPGTTRDAGGRGAVVVLIVRPGCRPAVAAPAPLSPSRARMTPPRSPVEYGPGRRGAHGRTSGGSTRIRVTVARATPRIRSSTAPRSTCSCASRRSSAPCPTTSAPCSSTSSGSAPRRPATSSSARATRPTACTSWRAAGSRSCSTARTASGSCSARRATAR